MRSALKNRMPKGNAAFSKISKMNGEIFKFSLSILSNFYASILTYPIFSFITPVKSEVELKSNLMKFKSIVLPTLMDVLLSTSFMQSK